MRLMTAIRLAGMLCGVGLLGFGLWFVLTPLAALSGTSHMLDRLPLVMGGRYFFFGALLIGALLHGDLRVLAFLLAGFAGLGFFDALVYLDADPIPHLLVGVLAAGAGMYFFHNRKARI